MSAPRSKIHVVVTGIADVAPAIRSFRLELTSAAPLPRFSGGSHIQVEIKDGAVTRRNAYSLLNAASTTDHYLIAVRRWEGGRGGSVFLHDRVQIGSTLAVSPPSNLFAVDRRAKKHLLIAGGIGITAILAIATELRAERRAFELHYAVRSRTHAAFADQLAALADGDLRLYPSGEGLRLDVMTLLADQPLGTHLYVCGPAPLIDRSLSAARELGWPEQSLHVERFAPPPVGAPFDVSLARSQLTVSVGVQQSMLDAIEAAGVEAPSMCRGGACGQCETRVLICDGTLHHHDYYLTDADKAAGVKVMPCVSRFEGGRLVLDL